MEIDKIKEKIRGRGVRIVFPEGNDERIVCAAGLVEKKGYAVPEVLQGGVESLKKAALMVSAGEADAIVAGADFSTATVFKEALKRIGLAQEGGSASSFFLMESEKRELGENGSFLFADCAIIPEPDAKTLVSIARDTAYSASSMLGWEPRVALLSFSTKGSSSHKSVLKVVNAAEKLKRSGSDFLFEGEIQLDAAIIPSISEKKDPRGILRGRANILIFPDLNSANIGYKIAERIGGMKATGPIFQGFKKPVNDLSRGCSVDDIVSVSCFTALQKISRREELK